MATGGRVPSGKDRAARETRERARLYQARTALHDAQQRRRVRDNVIAGVVGGILIAAIIGGEFAYYAAGPGAPVPAPTVSPTATVPVSPSPVATPSPTATP